MKPFPGGAIFDLDGVLVDTACDHFEAWQQMARSLGFELSPAQGSGSRASAGTRHWT